MDTSPVITQHRLALVHVLEQLLAEEVESIYRSLERGAVVEAGPLSVTMRKDLPCATICTTAEDQRGSRADSGASQGTAPS